MGNKIDFKYVPLSFIKNQNEIERQSINTVIFQKVLEEFGELKSLGELLNSTQYGYTASAQTQGNCQLLRITDIHNGHVNWDNIPRCNCERNEKYELSAKDILIARTGNNISYLVENNVPKNTVFASYLIRLTCNQKLLLPEYLYLFLNSYAFWPQILKKQRGALLQNVNAKRMQELLIPCCSINIQKKLIAHASESISHTQEKIRRLLRSQDFISTGLTHQQTLLKKLRQQILQEAIEGKLTADWREQNPDVEPASELLARIQAEKEQLIKDKKVKKQKPLPAISDAEKPFDLPKGWVWCRINDISQQITSGSRGWAKYYTDSGAIFVTMGNLSKNSYKLRMDKVRHVQPPKNSEGTRTRLEQGDLLISITGDVGNLGLIPENFGEAYINQHTCMLRYMPECRNNRYFLELMRSPLAQRQYSAPQRGIKNSFRLGDVGEMIISLPPLPEQKAIVSKVEKLLALCDQLETRITENQTHAKQLMQAVLKEAFIHSNESSEKVLVNA